MPLGRDKSLPAGPAAASCGSPAFQVAQRGSIRGGRYSHPDSGDTIRITGAEPFGSTQRLEAAMPSFSQFIVWIVIGLLGGSLAGVVITRDRKGFGLLRNLVIGLAGALVGGFLFRMLGLFPQLENVAISLRDIVAAFVGSLIVLGAFWLWQRYSKSQ
jgi:uncharacterized membrane protein YeaQ/YmgE (transglycosylase-associated protein family)